MNGNCKIKMTLSGVRRNLRWLIDHRENGIEGDCTEVLSQSYNLLRDAEKECLARRNIGACPEEHANE
jgi:hypothetical protein